MKLSNYLIKLSLLIILYYPYQIFSQWQDKGEYKEIKASNQPITQITTPKDSSIFYVVDDTHILRKYNYQGELILEKELKLEGYEFMRLCNDGLSCIFIKTIDSVDNDGWKFINKYFLCNDINSDSIIFERNLISYVIPIYSPGKSAYNIYFDFNFENKNGILIYNFDEWIGGLDRITYNKGEALIYDNISKELKSIISGKGYKCFDVSEYNKKILLNSIYYEGHEDSGFEWWIESKEFIFSNNYGLKFGWISRYHYESNYPYNNVNGFIPDIFKLANYDSQFVAVKNNYLYHYSFTNDSVNFIDSNEISYHPNAILYSPNDKYLIMASPNLSIGIYENDRSTMIKDYTLQDSVNAGIFVNLNWKNGFLAGNSKGKVKLFDADSILSDVDSPYDNYIHIRLISSSDYLYIQTSDLLQNNIIQIYSVEGIKFIEQNFNNEINIGNLSRGVYFIKIGNMIKKFMKY